MTLNNDRLNPLIVLILIVAATVLYGIHFFNYFQTPSSDYIGNFLPQVNEYMSGSFPGSIYKLLPLYPLILALLTPLNPISADDPIYLTAIIINFALFIPYLLLVYRLYRRHLNQWLSLAALLYLSANIYTVFTAVNAELEMLLALLCVTGIYLSLRDSSFSYVAAFLASLTKWDAVFMIPAVMFRDFFIHKRRIATLLLGTAAATGVVAWFIFTIVLPSSDNVYVAEIAQRGPNIYRFPADCILILSGFVQWMGLEGYYSGTLAQSLPRYIFIALFILLITVNTLWGLMIFIKKYRAPAGPVLVFFAGFIGIHMIYQNTKDRYVLPILWLLTLFLFTGIAEGMYPFLLKRIRFGRIGQIIVMALAAALYAWSAWHAAVHSGPASWLFAVAATCIAAVIVIKSGIASRRTVMVLLILITGSIINMQTSYGIQVMDHHGKSRVEFKNIALWYRDKYRPGDKMLIAERPIPLYYSKLSIDAFIDPYSIKSNTLQELTEECRRGSINYVFVDDFYIRRLSVGDKNAIDRKAELFKEVLEKGEAGGHFILLKKFNDGEGKYSYLFRFSP